MKTLKEDGCSKENALELSKEAIRGNICCAYYIAFCETFHKVMECLYLYMEEVEDAEDGTLEQAIECCHSEEMGNWAGTESAVEWIRGSILEYLNGKDGNDDDTDDEE